MATAPSTYQFSFVPKSWQGMGDENQRQYFGSPSIGRAHVGSKPNRPIVPTLEEGNNYYQLVWSILSNATRLVNA
jgi:hypothetical protein